MQPGFALTPENAAAVVAICRRLDGLPLAIELAAARVRILSPVAMLARLAGAPGLRSLGLLTGGRRIARRASKPCARPSIWSYTSSIPAAQVLFRRLAVFVGGFTPEAAEAVHTDFGIWNLEFGINPEQPGAATESGSPKPKTQNPNFDVLDGLTALVDQSLVRRQEGPGASRVSPCWRQSASTRWNAWG